MRVLSYQLAARLHSKSNYNRSKLRRMKYKESSKSKVKPRTEYRDLQDLTMFLYVDPRTGELGCFTKISDSYAVDEVTGKDHIFACYDKVDSLGTKANVCII